MAPVDLMTIAYCTTSEPVLYSPNTKESVIALHLPQIQRLTSPGILKIAGVPMATLSLLPSKLNPWPILPMARVGGPFFFWAGGAGGAAPRHIFAVKGPIADKAGIKADILWGLDDQSSICAVAERQE